MGTRSGPLAGVTVLELAGIGPGPYCGQLLADLGADVIVVHRPGPDVTAVDGRGKRSVIVDLRKPDGADVVLRLAARADVLIEGNRPGVAERLGIGPADCWARNPKLVYGRMTGWGQTGPWAGLAGHDINYLSITGALLALGPDHAPPPPPLNLIGDYGGGSLFLALGIVSALLRARTTGRGEIVDAAIVDGVASMLGIVHTLSAHGQWSPERHANILDGGAPYYRCYTTRDGRFMAVGAIEPQFFAKLIAVTGISPADYGEQNDKEAWPQQHRLLEAVFATKTREKWSAAFEGVDACVTPVLSYEEAGAHPHNRARGSHAVADGLVQPRPAPRFSRMNDDWTPSRIPARGADTAAVLAEAGFTPQDIARLAAMAVVGGEPRNEP